MAQQETEVIIEISGRWWSFPGAQIDGDSWEGEWRGDGKVYLRNNAGKMIEGRELSETEVEQLVAACDALPAIAANAQHAPRI